MQVRDETPADYAAVEAVHGAAFGTRVEADLVAVLRRRARPLVSLVAEQGDAVVGHILFSPATLAGHPDLRLMGLGPMGVLPQHQRTGIGTALVQAGLARCRRLGVGGVVVLGHPAYYPRFGFRPASQHGLSCTYEVPAEVFMALALEPDALKDAAGVVHYHEAFRDVS